MRFLGRDAVPSDARPRVNCAIEHDGNGRK
jgi:hypothetical protein